MLGIVLCDNGIYLLNTTEQISLNISKLQTGSVEADLIHDELLLIDQKIESDTDNANERINRFKQILKCTQREGVKDGTKINLHRI